MRHRRTQLLKVHVIIDFQGRRQDPIENRVLLVQLCSQLFGFSLTRCRVRQGRFPLKSLTILLRCSRGGYLRTLGGALRGLRTLDRLRLLTQRGLLPLFSNLRLMLKLCKESTTTCHSFPPKANLRSLLVVADIGLPAPQRWADGDTP